MSTSKAKPGRRTSAQRRNTPVDSASTEALNPPDFRDEGSDAPLPAESTTEHALEQALEALALDHETAERIQQLPHDIGWLLVTAGVVGVVMPGVLGVPFLVLGGLILLPGSNRRAERWLTGHSPKVFKGSIRQINRFLDDLERRYPRSGRP